MLPTPSTGSRRSPNLLISIPGTTQPPAFRPHLRPSGKFLFRYIPWAVACTVLLWLFVLRAENRPPPPTPPIGRHPHLRPGQHTFPYATRMPWKAPQERPHEPPEGGSWNWGAGKASKTQPLWDTRAEKVKHAFIHAFEGYRRHADGYDELLPVVGGKINNFNGWGVTLYDSLDTMWIMGLHDLFRDSLSIVAKADFNNKPGDYSPFFETTIRYLGGLLSAYALSGEPILLSRADDLGRMLLPAFDSPSGLPMFAVNTKSGQTKKGWSGDILWAEAMSNQMEFKYLAHITGRKEYYTKTEEIMQKMYNAKLTNNGLFPSRWNFDTGIPANEHYSVGAFADSAYEYLLKQWLLTSRSEPRGLEMYLNSTNAILEGLLHLTPKRNLLYVTDLLGDSPSHTLEHLSCFLPGLLALGVHTLPHDHLSLKESERHLWAAKGLAETCWVTYADTKTGLGADEVTMAPWIQDTEQAVGGRWLDHVELWEQAGRPGGLPPGAQSAQKETNPDEREWRLMKDSYLLRPETIESFYILWKTTGEVKWRERGWAIFESIERHTKTKHGYASINRVDQVPSEWKDEMPSYFLAETLKYLYLLFIEEDLIPFDYWVLNTEAHPLPIFDWAPWEKLTYDINNTTTKPTTTDTATSSTTESI